MSTKERYKIITISDFPLAPSGVGLQMKYLLDHLNATDKFNILSIGTAIHHKDKRMHKVEDWPNTVILPFEGGYGNPDLIRQMLDVEKPDAIFFFTDPRFYKYLWQMEDEVHQFCPLIYWHVWDEDPFPKYNKHYYESTDFVGCINKLTYNFLQENGFEDKSEYIPHGVPEDAFEIQPVDEIIEKKLKHFGPKGKKFIVFYNSRNALRKRTGNAIWGFKEFLDSLPEEEKGNVFFAMHTPPNDPEGQDLFRIVDDFDLKGNVGFSEGRVETSVMCDFYNMADVTVCASSEEGFGLSCLESLMCGTPVIATKTGGLQDQVVDERTGEVFGFCETPDARSLIGSQETPYLWSMHLDPSTIAARLRTLYDDKVALGTEKYKEKYAGTKARKSCMERFDLKKIQTQWETVLVREIEKFKSKKNSDKKVRTITF